MSGFWSIENVSDFEELWDDADGDESPSLIPTRETSDGKRQKLNAASALLIFMMPAIGIEEITVENASEVFIRLRMLEIALGGGGMLIRKSGDKTMLTLEDIRRHIGMRADADIAFGPFEKRLIVNLRSQANEDLKRATKPTT